MKKRHKMSRHKSKRSFKKGAVRVHPKNNLRSTSAMRGGIRL